MDVLENAAKTHHPGDLGGTIIPVGPCDVTKKDDLERLVSQISEKEKHIDLLIANAGISGPKADPKEEDASELKDKLWKSEDFESWG